MTYPQAVQYLGSFVDYERTPAYPDKKDSKQLERVVSFLSVIGSPQEDLKCIHVAGTKGKGSTCAFITYILREAGFKVGLYTSPHLSDLRERVRILSRDGSEPKAKVSPTLDFEGMISEEELRLLVERLRPAIEEFNYCKQYQPLTFFEIITALAFLYFKEKRIDIAVLETGLGGRLDATNVVDPLACVITPISYEHAHYLGNTLLEIAAEKAAIIKSDPRLSVIFAAQEEEVALMIRKRCQDAGVKLCEVGKDITYRKKAEGFSVKALRAEYPDLKIRLLGEHQLVNSSLAIGAVEALHDHGFDITADSIKVGLNKTIWPARCEVLSREPLVVLDGAQNAASARALAKTIKENFQYRKLILILGVLQDKDIKGICQELSPLADQVILTKPDNPRAIPPAELAKNFSHKNTEVRESIEEAARLALSKAGPQDLILVTGSLYLASPLKTFLKRDALFAKAETVPLSTGPVEKRDTLPISKKSVPNI
ncbi:bifunctional folylpolyglutamate synthase/dihydrofolate synthase [Candidatus Omnitrophota bacterium]